VLGGLHRAQQAARIAGWGPSGATPAAKARIGSREAPEAFAPSSGLAGRRKEHEGMKHLLRAFGSSALAALLVVSASADTIYMKNGSVIRGSVVGYADGEFTVMLNAGPGGARSRATLA